ncbi:MAG: SulP family inorganic anion transporter, partial [Candidatus Obscuribacterales bacterium]|nr:SulP family inorganic anion transporter [Candidatus Obscuribacterales bacterium]
MSFIRKTYLSNIPGDLIGGLTAAVVALPIALSFGVASGLGAAAGLYGAIACGFFASMLGGTAAQVSGPTGPLTVVVASMYAANLDRPEIVFASVVVAGILQIVLGRIRAGQLIEYIPYPVVSGFMTGIGLIIIVLQLNPLLGKEGTGKIPEAIQTIPLLHSGYNQQALVLGLLTIALIYVLPLLSKRLPATLLALVATTMVAVFANFDVPTIGAIPTGIPMPSIPAVHFFDVQQILLAGIALSILGSLDSLLTSVVADRTVFARHDSNQELTGQGIGNIAAGFFGGLPGAGATMRTIVNIRSGGRTRLSGMIHSVVMLLVVVSLGSMAAKIPLSVLAGILITVGLSIIDYRSFKDILKTPRSDVAVMLVVLVLTVFVDLIIAVLVGVCLACALFVKDMSDAQLSEHGHLDSLEHLIEIAAHLDQDVRNSIYIYTFNGP